MSTSSAQPPREPAHPATPRTADRVQQRLRRLEHDLADIERARARINRAVWGIALGVMIYGAINVTVLLVHHGVPRPAAPLLPLMVDLAMCAGLWGDRIMHRHGRHGRWVTGLRWTTAAMTLALNVTQPVLDTDWVGVGIHACGPLLLLVVAEAAGSFQRHFTEIAADLRDETDALAGAKDRCESPTAQAPPRETPTPMTSVTAPLTTQLTTPVVTRSTTPPANGGGPANSSANSAAFTDGHSSPPSETSDTKTGDTEAGDTEPRAGRPPTETGIVAGLDRHTRFPGQERDERDGPDRSETTTLERDDDASHGETPAPPIQTRHNGRDRQPADAQPNQSRRTLMWHYFQQRHARGLPVTGAELDRVAGTRNYGRAVIRSWVREGRITPAEVTATRNGPRRTALAQPCNTDTAHAAAQPP